MYNIDMIRHRARLEIGQSTNIDKIRQPHHQPHHQPILPTHIHNKNKGRALTRGPSSQSTI